MSIIFVLEIFIEMSIRLAIPGLVVSAVVILLIQKMLIKVSKEFRIIIYTLIIILCVIASFIFLLWKFEKPNELYLKMDEFHNSQSLIGKSKEEIVGLLGKPKYETTNRNDKRIYEYFAGTIRKEWFWGKCYSTEYYEFSILFDENDKVEHTYIQLTPSD